MFSTRSSRWFTTFCSLFILIRKPPRSLKMSSSSSRLLLALRVRLPPLARMSYLSVSNGSSTLAWRTLSYCNGYAASSCWFEELDGTTMRELLCYACCFISLARGKGPRSPWPLIRPFDPRSERYCREPTTLCVSRLWPRDFCYRLKQRYAICDVIRFYMTEDG